jgi:hypothetical protein
VPQIVVELNDTLFEELQQVLKETREPISLGEVASQCVESTLASRRLERLPAPRFGPRIVFDVLAAREEKNEL